MVCAYNLVMAILQLNEDIPQILQIPNAVSIDRVTENRYDHYNVKKDLWHIYNASVIRQISWQVHSKNYAYVNMLLHTVLPTLYVTNQMQHLSDMGHSCLFFNISLR